MGERLTNLEFTERSIVTFNGAQLGFTEMSYIFQGKQGLWRVLVRMRLNK